MGLLTGNTIAKKDLISGNTLNSSNLAGINGRDDTTAHGFFITNDGFILKDSNDSFFITTDIR